MTAEVAILNKSGVALAADSAVTITAAPGTPKIFDTVNKLFMLSKHAPVGLMVYSNAEYMGVPWEVLVKSFRRSLGRTRRSRLADYVQDLIEFVRASPPYSLMEPQRRQVHGVVHRYFHRLRTVIDDDVAEALESRDTLTRTAVQRLAGRTVKQELGRLQQLPDLEAGPEPLELRRTFGEVFDGAIDAVFHGLPLSEAARASLRRLAVLYLTKEFFELGVASGVVITGYGEDDVFPAMVHLQMDGTLLNTVRHQVLSDDAITDTTDAIIRSFAQSEMVGRFMEGVDPGYAGALFKALEQLLASYPGMLSDVLKQIDDGDVRRRVRAELRQAAPTVVDALRDFLDEYARKRFVEPIVNSVGALPKDQLAAMAEALVNLTSFKRRVSVDEPETVGGPVDVAVISKGDGFVWIERKHYFRPELNHRFFETYFDDAQYTQGQKEADLGATPSSPSTS